MAFTLFNPRNLMRTPPTFGAYGNDESPTARPSPTSRPEPPIKLPFGSPPLTGTVATEPPRLEQRQPGAAPEGARPPMVAAGSTPSRVVPFAPPTIKDYRGNQVSDEVGFARDQYMRKGGTVDPATGKLKVNRSFKNTLANAGAGFQRGLASGGGLGAGLGGAAAGALGATISPLRGREIMFDTFQRPALEESIARTAAERARVQGEEDRRRQTDMDEMRRRELDVRMRKGELEIADYPDEMKSRREERTARSAKLAAEAEALPGETELQNREREVRAAKLEAELEDMPEERESRRRLREAQANKLERPEADKPNTAANTFARQVSTLESKARGAWDKWSNFRPGIEYDKNADPKDLQYKEDLRLQAQSAQQEYNSAAKNLGQQFGDEYEIDTGGDGFAVVRRRGSSAGPSNRSSGSRSEGRSDSGPRAKLSDLKNRYLR